MSISQDQRRGAVGLSDEKSKELILSFDQEVRDVERFLRAALSEGAGDQDSLLVTANDIDVARTVYNRLSSITDDLGVERRDVEVRFSSLDRSVGYLLQGAGYSYSNGEVVNALFSPLERGMYRIRSGVNTALGQYSFGVRQEVMNGIILGKSVNQIAHDAVHNSGVLSNGMFSEKHVRLAIQKTVRWNVQQAVNFGVAEYYEHLNETYGLDIKGQWQAQVATACISCLELHGTIVDMGSAFDVPSSFHQKYYGAEMIAPPLHVNCKCTIVPYLESLEGTGAFDTPAMRAEADSRIEQLREENKTE